jgi:predicted  nucleic acid-binding Zn-ribbon protein
VSNSAKPELQAIADLEIVVRHLADELAGWRRRALRAEAERAEIGAGHDAVTSREKVVRLERESRDLKERLDTARTRVGDLLKRLQFLEEQAETEATH